MKNITAYDKPLFSLARNGVTEVTVFGEIVAVSRGRIALSTHEVIGEYPMRSLLKPFQFLATGLPREEWAGDRATARIAAAIGSVSATAEQMKSIRDWYAAPQFSPRLRLLQCGAAYPLDDAHRAILQERGAAPEVVFHNCFSKHMAILESCERNQWPSNYTAIDHPYQRRLLASLASLLEKEDATFVTVEDGCHLPSPVLSLREGAELYDRLFNRGEDSRLSDIATVMLRFPEWVGGDKRNDTRLMRIGRGKIVAKEGADGLLALGVGPTHRFPEGVGIVIKLASGWQPLWSALVATHLVKGLGFEGIAEPPPGQQIHFHFSWEGYETTEFFDISPVVDEKIAVWPGDAPFRRKVSLDTFKGDHLTLSSIEGSVHVGAHTDAPNHYFKSDIGIDRVDLKRYQGVCQVIEVKLPPNSRIEAKHIHGVPIRAPRVIFKTGSYPDPQKFNSDFVALSRSVIELLVSKGVFFVGVDTPSIDSFDSKDMPAHQATIPAQVSILEGIDLSGVSEGFYDILAIPLRLGNADASPVRALLRPRPV